MERRAGFVVLLILVILPLIVAGCSGTPAGLSQGPPSITTKSLPNGGVGGEYSTTITVSGGTPNFSWSVASGSLPAGLTLGSSSSSTVVISGTPTAQGSSTFTIKVTDAKGDTATSGSLTITIGTLAITTTSPLANGTIGTAYSAQFAASGGTSPYQWSVASGSTLPAGLTLNSSGLLSGTPTTAGTTTFGITVSDAESPSAQVTQTFSITIAGANGLALLKGPFAFEFSGFNTVGAVVTAGSFTADGAGNITNGVEDYNSIQGPPKNQTFTGTYTLGSDNRGTLAFSSISGSPTYAFSIDVTGAHGRLVEFDASGTRGSGQLEKQTVISCGANTISTTNATGENYVFGVTGTAAAVGGVTLSGPMVIAGAFTALPPPSASVPGSFANGAEADVNIPGIALQSPPGAPSTVGFPLSGTFQATSQTSRCTMSLTPQQTSSTLNFSVYPVSGSSTALTEAFLVETDKVQTGSPYLTAGKMIQQCILVGNSCSTSPFVGQTAGTFFTAASVGALVGEALNTPNVYVPDVAIAELTGTSGISFTMSVVENQAGNILTYQSPFQANFVSLDQEGRVATTLVTPFAPVFYVISQNEFLCIGALNNNPFFGIFEPQTGAPFSASTIKGSFIEGTSAPPASSVEDFSGVVTLDGVSAVTGTQDVSTSTANTAAQAVSGTYTSSTSATGLTGAGTYVLTTPSPFAGNFFIVTPTKFVFVSTIIGNANPVLVTFGN